MSRTIAVNEEVENVPHKKGHCIVYSLHKSQQQDISICNEKQSRITKKYLCEQANMSS